MYQLQMVFLITQYVKFVLDLDIIEVKHLYKFCIDSLSSNDYPAENRHYRYFQIDSKTCRCNETNLTMKLKLTNTVKNLRRLLAEELDGSFSKSHFELAQEKLKYLLGGIFGYYALLYSEKAKTLVDNNVVVKNSVVISEQIGSKDMNCSYEELPIASDCIDLVVLPEILQQSQYPHQILREVERVLIPDGHIILIMENPISWLSLKKRFIASILGRNGNTSLYGRLRIGDWFRLLGLEMLTETPICPIDDRIQQSNNPAWVKKSSRMICSFFSGYYIIVAKKKVSTLIPIRPSWRSNRKLVSPRFADPSVNSKVDDYLKQFK